eukprot:gene292-918_t
MSLGAKYNTRSPAVKRLMREASELHEPTYQYHAQPLEDNLFEWHFTVRGAADTEFSGGIYHGRVLLPPEYPMKPPSIMLSTPNGRFETGKKICLSMSAHHPETWQPSWSIRTVLLAIIGFMPSKGEGAIGALDYSTSERKVLAKRSLNWTCNICGCKNSGSLPEAADNNDVISEEAREIASQISFKSDKDEVKKSKLIQSKPITDEPDSIDGSSQNKSNLGMDDQDSNEGRNVTLNQCNKEGENVSDGLRRRIDRDSEKTRTSPSDVKNIEQPKQGMCSFILLWVVVVAMADNVKKCSFDVYVKESRLKEVEEKIDRIKDLFNVELKYGSNQGKQYMVNPGKWFEVVGCRENASKAREYVKGLSNPEEVVRFRIPDTLFECLSIKSPELERETAAIISFTNNGEIVEISGGISRVTKAAMNIEHAINLFIEQQNIVRTEPNSNIEHNHETVGLIFNTSNNNFHSTQDAETDPNVLQSQCCIHEQQKSSTIVDDDFRGNLDKQQQSCSNCTNNNIANGSGTIQETNDNNLSAELMEFGLKLGYSEDEVKGAMKKLGNETAVNKNELLHELIKASTSAKQIGKSEEMKTENSAGYPRPMDTNILRHVVIDGSNIAMSHGKNVVFSCRGIAIAVDWFRKRGHKVTVFVPNWRKEASKPDTPIVDQDVLSQLEKDGILSYTPSRRIQGKLVQCYDDRYIVKLALETDGVIVSNDHFRDLQEEGQDWKSFIERRLLMYTFANENMFMPPDDPLGRHGPSLDEFLRTTGEQHKLRQCPYGRKCTFGHKCRFFHPERSSYSNTLRSKSFLNNPMYSVHQQQSPQQQQQQQIPGRPRSDPIQPNAYGVQDANRQRPISLPNLEQLWISNPNPNANPNPTPNPNSNPFVHVNSIQPHNGQSRPVSGPPFQEGQNMMPNSNGNAPRRLSGEFTHFSMPQGGQYVQQVLLTRQMAQQTTGDYVGRPLSSDFSSRPPSEDFSYCSGSSRPESGEYASRPNSGDYGGTAPWNNGLAAYQRPVSFGSGAVHPNQIPYFDTRNFYPVKGFYKNRAPPMPETKEETRITNGLNRMDLLDKLRELFPDHFDKILSILRNHPDIASVEDAAYLIMNE